MRGSRKTLAGRIIPTYIYIRAIAARLWNVQPVFAQRSGWNTREINFNRRRATCYCSRIGNTFHQFGKLKASRRDPAGFGGSRGA